MITDVMQAPGHHVESIHTMLSDIYSALDPLRDLFEDLKYDYPQVMVLGNEKAGKSTLLERLAMRAVFPIARDTCTKMAIQLQLRRRPATVPQIDVVDLTTNQVVNTYSGFGEDLDVQEVMDRISQAEQAASQSVISTDKMLVIRINSPDVPNIDLMDTPGLTAAGAHDRHRRARKVVDTQIARHLKHSIFLLVISAKDSVAGQHGFQVVATNEDLKRWSIGVITKSDTVEYDDHGIPGYTTLPQRPLDYQMQADVDLPNGYVYTSNRNSGDRTFATQRERLEHQAREEVAFFDGLPEGLVARDRATVPMLIQRLSHLVYDYMRDKWLPQGIKRIAVAARQEADKMVKLGLPPAHTPEELSPDRVAALRDAATTVIRGLIGREQERVLEGYLKDVLEPLQAALCGATARGTEAYEQEIQVPATSLPSTLERHAASARTHLQAAVTKSVTYFGVAVLNLLESDASPFRLGRFPQVIAHLAAHLTTLLEDAMQQAARRAEEDIQALTKVPSLFAHVTYDLRQTGAMPQARLVLRRRLLADSLINHILTSAVLEVLPAWSNNVAEYLADTQLTWKEACADKRASCLQRTRHLENAQDVIRGLLRPEEEALQAILEAARLDYEGLTEGSDAGDEEAKLDDSEAGEEAKGEDVPLSPISTALLQRAPLDQDGDMSGSEAGEGTVVDNEEAGEEATVEEVPLSPTVTSPPQSAATPYVFLDLGAYITKATLSTPNAPRVTFYSVVTNVRRPSLLNNNSLPPVIVGMDANGIDMSHYNKPKFPLMSNTLESNVENIECLLRHAFDRLGVSPADWPLVITEHGEASQATRARAQVLIDVALSRCNVPCVTYVPQARLLASSLSTVHEDGLVVDLGHRLCTITRVRGGMVEAPQVLEWAGMQVVGGMGSQLRNANQDATSRMPALNLFRLVDRAIRESQEAGPPSAIATLRGEGLAIDAGLFLPCTLLSSYLESALQAADLHPTQHIILTGKWFTYGSFTEALFEALPQAEAIHRITLDDGDVCKIGTSLCYEEKYKSSSITREEWASSDVRPAILDRVLG